MMYECKHTYAKVNKVLMDFEQLTRMVKLTDFSYNRAWREMRRYEKVDEIMTLEVLTGFATKEKLSEVTSWVLERLANMLDFIEQYTNPEHEEHEERTEAEDVR